MKKIILILIVVLMALAGGWFYQSRQQADVKLAYYTVGVGDIHSSVSAVGDISAAVLVDVGAEVTGQIQSFQVEIGDEVKQNQLLAKIDASRQQAALADAKSNLASAEAQLQLARVSQQLAAKNFKREQRLNAGKASSDFNLEQAKLQLAQSDAQLRERSSAIEAAKIAVENATTNLQLTDIKAPIAGTVVSTAVRAGQSVNAAQSSPTLLQIADLDKVLLRLQISEADIGKIQKGQTLQFTTLSGSREYQSQIESIDPGLTIMSRGQYSQSLDLTNSAIYYYARASIDNQDRSLQIGMTVQGEIVTASQKGVIVVPNEYLRRINNQDFVQIRAHNAKGFEMRKVKVGISDGLQSEITQGLQQGDEITLAAAGADGKKPSGAKVRIGGR